MKLLLIITHLAAAIIITGILLLIYASVQQVYRSSANDPQIQLARQASADMCAGKSINKYFSFDTISLTQSLATFIELFDKNGQPLKSTGLLNGSLPQLPAGIFEFTKQNKEDILTWQPQPGVRMAMVCELIEPPCEGYIAVGRSLKETEIRAANLVKIISITWIACMLVLLTHSIIYAYCLKKAK